MWSCFRRLEGSCPRPRLEPRVQRGTSCGARRKHGPQTTMRPALARMLHPGLQSAPVWGAEQAPAFPVQSLRPHPKTPPGAQLRLVTRLHRALRPAHEEDAEPRGCWPKLTCSLRSRVPSREDRVGPGCTRGSPGPEFTVWQRMRCRLPRGNQRVGGGDTQGGLPPSGLQQPGSKQLRSYSFPGCHRKFSSL